MTTTARRPRTARRAALAVLATATALGATALTAPAAGAAEPKGMGQSAPKFELKDGTLEWGVKESFRKYVASPIAGGKIETADGARQAGGNGAFTFGEGTGTYDVATHAVSTTFKGSVRFTGHGGELDLKFSDLKLKADDGKHGSITADVTTGGKSQDDVAIASLDLSAVKPGRGADGAMTFAKIPVKLTAAGAQAFAYKGRPMYQEGTELDTATLSVKAAPASSGSGSQDQGTQTDTGKGKDAGTQTDTGKSEDKGADKSTQTDAGKGTQTDAGKDAGKGQDPKPQPGGDKAAASGQILDGNLDWGVKETFRKYITGPIAGGKAELSAGAVKSGDGYRFTKAGGDYDAAKATVNATFAGALRFTGHGGELDLTFSNFKVKAAGTTGTLSADVTTKSGVSKDLPLADLKLPADALKAKDGVVTLSGVQAALTAQGEKAFTYNNKPMYPAGTALDPVTLAVAVDKNAKLPANGATSGGTTGTGATGGTTGGSGSVTGGTGSGTGTLANTGASTPTGALLGGAGALLLAGGAATYVARRRTGRMAA
ncbi:HtaA domain-containing protein [Streptomyces gamaensis]|uniref:HtaA domain-containing protein n=1 Tax=Streptomyces gamaensis TaxID=1763542 RepID=A0ABW0Z7X3_9ACTN